ncbi:DUF1287 domain-containing protein [Clostridium cavendishii]|nr:DUF1287 domain-containing protein [Clostridium cavendishii]
MKKRFVVIFLILIVFGGAYIILANLLTGEQKFNIIPQIVKVKDESSKKDNNKNGIADTIDIVEGARKEVKNKTVYKDAYYEGGYPKEGEGVCTDVIWRGLKEAGINLKDEMDKDIRNNLKEYKRVKEKVDPNIDFRRVANQDIFFQRHLESITTEIKAMDKDNLKLWHPGDIVVFTEGYEHVGIISDKRDFDGVPFVIHNTPPHAKEVKLTWFKSPIHGHYRWKY